MSYSPLPPLGQDTMSDSLPVVIASDQTAIDVKLKAGSTALVADAEGHLIIHQGTESITLPDAISNTRHVPSDDSGTPIATPTLPYVFNGTTWDRQKGDATNGTLVNLGANNDVTVSSSALPSGASTSAKQDTIIGHVDGIEGLLTTIDADTGNISTKIDTIAGAVSGTEMQVDLVGSLPAGTNAIGKLSANSGVDIGDVDVTSAVITGGAVAHDSADSGNPIKVGARASATLSDDTMVANGDRIDNVGDVDGALITRDAFPLGDLISERVSNTDGSSTAFSNFGATASTRNCVSSFHVFRTDSGTTPIYVDFRDGTSGSVLYSVVIPAGTGANNPPYSGSALFRTSANTALAYDVSAATSTVYISISGFKSKV